MKPGDIYLLDIPSSKGREQMGFRPAVIITSVEVRMVMVVPCTSNQRASRFPHVIELNSSKQNGLSLASIALVFQLRAIDQNKLTKKMGKLEEESFFDIKKMIGKMLSLN